MDSVILSNSQSPRRIEFIDTAKGFCILLVIALHSNVEIPMNDQVQLPLFFFISGLFFRPLKWNELIAKKINSLLIPFFIFNIIGEIYFYFETKYLSASPTSVEWLEILTFHKANGVIWFLLALFEDFIILNIIIKSLNNRIIQAIAVVALAFVGYCMFGEFNDFYFASSLLSLPYFFIGYLAKNAPLLTSNEKRFIDLLMGFMLLLLTLIYIKFIDDACIIYALGIIRGNILSTYLLGIVSLFGVIFISIVR